MRPVTDEDGDWIVERVDDMTCTYGPCPTYVVSRPTHRSERYTITVGGDGTRVHRGSQRTYRTTAILPTEALDALNGALPSPVARYRNRGRPKSTARRDSLLDIARAFIEGRASAADLIDAIGSCA